MIDRRRKKHLQLYVLAGNNLAKKENRFGCFKEGKLFKIWRSFSSDDLIQNRLLASARAIAEEDFLKKTALSYAYPNGSVTVKNWHPHCRQKRVRNIC